MATATRIEAVGDNLVLHYDDGTSVIAAPSSIYSWIVPNDSDDDTGSGGGNGGDSGGTGGSGGGFTVGPVPDSLTVSQANGVSYTLNKTQLTWAAKIIGASLKIQNAANRTVIRIALITSIVESVLYMYANTTHYPETAGYPHDRDGSDSDSVGLFQQRPAAGWGTPKQCMTVDYSVNAFINGTANNRGLFGVPNWRTLSPGQAAQAVQVSAFPDRYDQQVPVANRLMDVLLKEDSSGSGGSGGAWQWPFKYSQWVILTGPIAPLAQYGMRVNPVTGVRRLHAGLDFGVGGINGKPIPAAAAGTVTEAGYNGAMGNHVIIDHGNGFVTRYFHMIATPSVVAGQKVTKGQTLGNVGSTGLSTGPHLHWETIVNGQPQNPRDFMKARGVPES